MSRDLSSTVGPSWVDDLAAKFRIDDRECLDSAINRAWFAAFETANRPELDDQRADTLDKLGEHLHEVNRLLADPSNIYRLARDDQGIPWIVPLYDLQYALHNLEIRAHLAHRERSHGTGPMKELDLRAAVRVLVDFWVNSLNRKFARSAKWEGGKPTARGELFVFRILKQLFPGREDKLKSLAAEFVKSGAAEV
jgi:hypothetical protein